MKFSYGDDQQEFAATLRQALRDRSPASRWLHPAADVAGDPAWNLLVSLQAVAPDVPEHLGGLGLSAVELVLIAEELGRVVAPAAFTGGVGFAQGLLIEAVGATSSDSDLARVLADAAGGARLVLGATPAGRWDQLVVDEEGCVTGEFVAPFGAQGADLIVAVAIMGDGPALAIIEAAEAAIVALDGIDPTAGSAHVALRSSSPSIVVRDGVSEARSWARRRARVATAAEALGGARACLDMTVLYATQREQFGTPIGAFQSVKHRLADLLVETELAASAVYLAACELAARDDSSELSGCVAVELATAVFQRAARDCVQLHGGMGFTWEHPAHLYLERAQLLAMLHGRRNPGGRYPLIERAVSA